jgi:hypothetical protein
MIYVDINKQKLKLQKRAYNPINYLWIFIKNNNPITKIKHYFYKNKFMNKKLIRSKIYKNNWDIDIYIISFNRPELIENQIYFLNKNLNDNFRIIIVDNSNIESKSKEIEEICNNNKVSYIKLPKNKLKASHSHWLSLNYTMKNIISKSDSKYIWFLDHDCFLIDKISIVDILKKQKLWGVLVDDTPVRFWKNIYNFAWNRWFLRPWCSFFEKNLFSKWYNFLPTKKRFPMSFLDTWWWNWKYIYKYYTPRTLNLLSREIDKKDHSAENIWNIFIHLRWAWYRNEKIILDMLETLKKRLS